MSRGSEIPDGLPAFAAGLTMAAGPAQQGGLPVYEELA